VGNSSSYDVVVLIMFVLGDEWGNNALIIVYHRSDAAEASVHEEGRAAAALGATILMQLGTQTQDGIRNNILQRIRCTYCVS